jgi:hypothetical protein
MRGITLTTAASLGAATILTACSNGSQQSGIPPKAAHHYYLVDVSSSTATMNDPSVADAVGTRIGEDMKRDTKLGDALSVFEAGDADAARMVGHPSIMTGYKLRLPAAQAELLRQLRGIAQRYHAQGGDNATHLVQSLEAVHPDCSSGRDTVTLVTDGLEEDGDMSSVRALATGKPVQLPTSGSGAYLAGCRARFLGFGLTDDGTGKAQLLPTRQLAALRQGWLTYLTQAGMRAEDVEFVSAF